MQPLFKDSKKTPVGNRKLEFDVATESMDDKDTILVGECKWKSAYHAEQPVVKRCVPKMPSAICQSNYYSSTVFSPVS